MTDTQTLLLHETVTIIGMFALAGWLLWLFFRRYQIKRQESERRLEVFGKMVDKFGNSDEFVGFVRSDEGRRLLKESGVNGVNPKQVALRMFIVAALLFAVGYGFMQGTSAYDNSTDPNFVNKVADLRYWGRMSFGLAIGFIAAGGLTMVLGGDKKSHRGQ